MKNPKRTFLIGIIVGLLFFGWWFKGFLYINWRFHLFSTDSWSFLWNELDSGWHLSTAGDWIFMISFFLSGPLYLLVWYWANKIRWLRLIKKILHFIKKMGQKFIQFFADEEAPKAAPVAPAVHRTIKKAPPISQQRPIPMPSVGATMHTRPLNTQAEVSPMMSPVMPMASGPVEAQGDSWDLPKDELQKIAQTPLSDIQLPQNEQVQEDVASILKKQNFTVWTGVQIDTLTAPWVALAKGLLIWIQCDDLSGDWLADEEAFNDEDPLWFSETDHRISPVFQLLEQTKRVASKISSLGMKVRPVLIERKGNLINAEDMLKTWNDLGVDVCRTDVGGPVQLKTVSELFNQPVEAISEAELEQIKQLLS